MVTMPFLMRFLSTPSARRVTKAAVVDIFQHRISIHALREEGDTSRCIPFPEIQPFLSTPSARRATRWAMLWRQRAAISIHALREEGDKPSA